MNKEHTKKARYHLQTSGKQELYDRITRLKTLGVTLTDIMAEGCATIEKKKGIKKP